MNCRDFENKIQNLLDQRLSLDSSPMILTHASQCTRCQKQLEIYQSVFEPDGLLVEVNLDNKRSVSKLARIQQVSGVLAAAVAIIMIVWLSYITENQNKLHSSVASAQPGLSVFGAQPDFAEIASAGSTAKSTGQRDHENTLAHLSKLTPAVNSLRSKLPDPIEKLQPHYNYTTQLPVVRPWKNGIDSAVNLIRKSIDKPSRNSKRQLAPEHLEKYNPVIQLGFRLVV